jgi:hypothetical protein
LEVKPPTDLLFEKPVEGFASNRLYMRIVDSDSGLFVWSFAPEKKPVGFAQRPFDTEGKLQKVSLLFPPFSDLPPVGGYPFGGIPSGVRRRGYTGYPKTVQKYSV